MPNGTHNFCVKIFIFIDGFTREIDFIWPTVHDFGSDFVWNLTHFDASASLMYTYKYTYIYKYRYIPNDFKLLFHLLFILTEFLLNYLSLSTEASL